MLDRPAPAAPPPPGRPRDDEAACQADRLHLLYTVTADPAESIEEQVRPALALTASLLGVPNGVLARVEGTTYTIVACHAAGRALRAGDVFDLEETYCAIALELDDVWAVEHMSASPHRSRPCYDAFGLEAYVGAPVRVSDAVWGALCFSGPQPAAFAEDDLVLGAAQVGYYIGPWYLRARTVVAPRAERVGVSTSATARYYLADGGGPAAPIVEVAGGQGQEVVVGAPGGRGVPREAWFLATRGQAPVYGPVTLALGLSYTADDDLTRWGLDAGLTLRW